MIQPRCRQGDAKSDTQAAKQAIVPPDGPTSSMPARLDAHGQGS